MRTRSSPVVHQSVLESPATSDPWTSDMEELPSASRQNTNDNDINDSDALGGDALGGGPLACKWQGCALYFGDERSLYAHLCNDHVQRKSKAAKASGGAEPAPHPQKLDCRWLGCRVSVLKRDHLTSHLRIHIDLKPYSCDHCRKTFKRPHDLKKHVKVHTSKAAHPSGASTPATQATQPALTPQRKSSIAKRRALQASIALAADARKSHISPEFTQPIIAQRLTHIAPILEDVDSLSVDAAQAADLNRTELAAADTFLSQVSQSIAATHQRLAHHHTQFSRTPNHQTPRDGTPELEMDVDRLDADRSDVDRLDADRSDVDRFDADRTDVDRFDADRTDPDRLDADRMDVDRLDHTDFAHHLRTPAPPMHRPVARRPRPRRRASSTGSSDGQWSPSLGASHGPFQGPVKPEVLSPLHQTHQFETIRRQTMHMGLVGPAESVSEPPQPIVEWAHHPQPFPEIDYAPPQSYFDTPLHFAPPQFSSPQSSPYHTPLQPLYEPLPQSQPPPTDYDLDGGYIHRMIQQQGVEEDLTLAEQFLEVTSQLRGLIHSAIEPHSDGQFYQ